MTKRKKRQRKDSDIGLPPLPEGVTKEDIARALVGPVESVGLAGNGSNKKPNRAVAGRDGPNP